MLYVFGINPKINNKCNIIAHFEYVSVKRNKKL